MPVIGLRELILDYQHAVIRQVPADHIKKEGADRMLRCRQLNVQAESIGQRVSVVTQSRGEVGGFPRPDNSRVNRSQPAHFDHPTHPFHPC